MRASARKHTSKNFQTKKIMGTTNHDGKYAEWTKWQRKSIRECAEVLYIREEYLVRLVQHLQTVDLDMCENQVSPYNIESIVLSIKADGEWFTSTENDPDSKETT